MIKDARVGEARAWPVSDDTVCKIPGEFLMALEDWCTGETQGDCGRTGRECGRGHIGGSLSFRVRCLTLFP